MTGSTIIGIALILLYHVYLISEVQNGKNLFNKKHLRISSFKTRKSNEDIYQLLFTMCPNTKYSIEFLDKEKGHILLSESITLLHGGFFYPITISPAQDNTTEVTIGVKSKILWSGFLVFKSHRNLYNLIKLGLE